MKITLTTNEIADILIKDEFADWSYNGALALAGWLEDVEDEPETEIDPVALRCDFDEYPSALEAALNYTSIGEIVNRRDGVDNLAETENSALEYLREETLVIEFDGGVIVRNF